MEGVFLVIRNKYEKNAFASGDEENSESPVFHSNNSFLFNHISYLFPPS